MRPRPEPPMVELETPLGSSTDVNRSFQKSQSTDKILKSSFIKTTYVFPEIKTIKKEGMKEKKVQKEERKQIICVYTGQPVSAIYPNPC